MELPFSLTEVPSFATNGRSSMTEVLKSVTEVRSSTTELPLFVTEVPSSLTEVRTSSTNGRSSVTELPLFAMEVPSSLTDRRSSAREVRSSLADFRAETLNLMGLCGFQPKIYRRPRHCIREVGRQSLPAANMENGAHGLTHPKTLRQIIFRVGGRSCLQSLIGLTGKTARHWLLAA